MNKGDITALIATIDDGGLNTAAEIRAILENVRDNAYGDIINEYPASSGIITNPSANTNLSYNVNFVKQGRVVTMNGSVYNSGSPVDGSALGNELFTVLLGDYLPDVPSTTNLYLGLNATDNTICKLDFVPGGKFLYAGTIPSSKYIFFSVTYFTQD